MKSEKKVSFKNAHEQFKQNVWWEKNKFSEKLVFIIFYWCKKKLRRTARSLTVKIRAEGLGEKAQKAKSLKGDG